MYWPVSLAVELPQDAELAHREHRRPPVDVDENPLEGLVHVVRLARQVLEVPLHLAGGGVEREGRAGVEGVPVGAPAHLRPRLGLRHPPEREPEGGVVGPGDPGVAAAPEHHRQVAPGVAARLARPRHRRRAPQLAAGGGVVPGDEAAVVPEPQAAGHAGDDNAVHDERPARELVPLGGVGDLRLPRHLAGPPVEGDDVRVGGVEDDAVAVDGDVAVGPPPAARGRELAPVLPQQVAGRRVEGLHDVAGAREVHHAVVHDGGRLLRPGLHRPRPLHPQLADVVAGDLVQRAVTPAVAGAAPVQPALRRRVREHGVGDRPHFRRLAEGGRGACGEDDERGEKGQTVHRGLPVRTSGEQDATISRAAR